jgi:hypothetical protein
MNLDIFVPLIMKSCFWYAICMYVCMRAPLVRQWLSGSYLYSLFKGLYILGHYPVNQNILAPKIRGFKIDPKTNNDGFLKSDSNYFN